MQEIFFTFTTRFILYFSGLFVLGMSSQLSWANQPPLSPTEQAWLDEHPGIRISGPKSFPPFQFLGSDGKFQGIANDYIRLLADMFNLEIEVVKGLTWPKVLDKIEQKEIDVLSCASQSPDRTSYLSYTKPHLSFPLVIITRKDAPFVSSIEGLNNVKVACIRKVATYEWLKRDKIAITPHFVDSPFDALEAVSLGSADAAIQNLAAATYLIEKNGLTNLKVAAPTSYGNYDLSIAVRQDWPELVSIFDKGLEALSQQQHDQIRQKWIAVRYEHGIQSIDVIIWIFWIILAATLILALFYFWNRSLKKEIIERKKAEKSLIESEERFKALHDASFGGIIIHAKGLILECNQGLSEMSGFTNEELIGMDGLKLIAPHCLDQVLENINSGYDRAYEVEGVRKDGSIYPMAIRGKNVQYKGREVRVIEFRDITERINLEKQLRQAHKTEAIGTMAGGIAHNFNNILGAILGYADMAYYDIPEASPARVYLKQTINAATRAKELVKHIVTFSHQENSTRSTIQPSALLSEYLNSIRDGELKNIVIEEAINSDISNILIDPHQFKIIITNLCSNAFDAMHEKGGVLTVTLKDIELKINDLSGDLSVNPGQFVMFTVSDTGQGITQKNQGKVFDPFFTTKEVGKGDGVGLSVVQGIVRKSGGLIKVESEVGKGSDFHVFLPVAETVSE